MSGISGIEVARLRHDSEQYMPDAVHVYTPAVTRGSSGVVSYTFPVTPSASTHGRISPMSNELETFYAEKLGGKQGFTVTVPESVVVTGQSRLEVGSRTLEVVGVDTDRSWQFTRRYGCRELT